MSVTTHYVPPSGYGVHTKCGRNWVRVQTTHDLSEVTCQACLNRIAESGGDPDAPAQSWVYGLKTRSIREAPEEEQPMLKQVLRTYICRANVNGSPCMLTKWHEGEHQA